MTRARITIVAMIVAAVAALGATAASNARPHTGGPPDTTVTAWDTIGTQAFTAAALTPAEGHTIFAYVAIAVYDSVMAIEGGYEPFAIDVDVPDASPQAAVAAAAHRILAHYLPAQAPTIIDPAYVTSLAAIPAGQGKTDGIGVGESVAALLIAQRSGDGFRAPVTYTAPNPPVPGAWIPTCAPTPPIGPYLGLMKPFSLDSADQFRPGGPPPLEARSGRGTTTRSRRSDRARPRHVRTPAQTLAARFWAEPPVQQARGSLRKFVLDHQLDIRDAARFMAMASVTYADALDRVLRREVPLRVLEADHRHPRGRHGRQRRDRRRSRLDAAAPGHTESSRVPERALVRHAGRGARRLEIPRYAGDRLHRSEPDRAWRPPLRRAKDLEYEVGERPRLGRHPLPLRGRGRRRDREKDRPRGACTPLQAVERLEALGGRPATRAFLRSFKRPPGGAGPAPTRA